LQVHIAIPESGAHQGRIPEVVRRARLPAAVRLQAADPGHPGLPADELRGARTLGEAG